MNKHLGTLRAWQRAGALAFDRIRSKPGGTGPTKRRMRRSLLSVLAVVLVAFGLPLAIMSPASAHTPNLTKSCSGITVTGSWYESKDTNTLGIKVDGGAWTTKTFTISDSLTVPVPQDGLVHTYKAYVHTTNSNSTFSKDYEGTVGPCGKKHVTAAQFTKTDPTCAADGKLVVTEQPEGVEVSRSPYPGTGPGHYTITFRAKSGYALDGPTKQIIEVLPKLTGDQCATEVQPVKPTITHPTCTGPGTGTAGSFILPANGGGVAYTKSGNVVTATADGTHKFVSLPSGWTLVDSHHATYQVNYVAPDGYPACLVDLAVPVPPVAVLPTCDTDGDLVVGTTPHVVTRVDGDVVTEDTHFGPGTHEVSYAAAPGYAFEEGAEATFSLVVKGKTLDCPVTPVDPTVTQSVCTGPGTHTEPVVVPGDVPGDHIEYVYDEESQLVTASPEAGYALANLPDGWESQEDGTATFAVELDDPGPCLVEIEVPTPPVPTEPTCDVDGALTVMPTTHVVTTVDGNVVEGETGFGPGEHTVAYAPAAGYTFAREVVTEKLIVVLPSTKDCPTGVVSPTVAQSVCTGPGTHSEPVVTPGDAEGDHVSYAYDSVTRIVTATPDTGFVLAEMPAGWTGLENGEATFQVVLTDPGPCLVTVVEPPTTGVDTVVAGPTPSTLPNTGAPALWPALAGLVLLLGGGLLVAGGRRRHRS